jgi:predicted secreted protein
MSAMKGRAVVVTRNGTPVAGARTKSITINGSPIDVTTDDADAVQKLLDEPGQVDVAISVSGILLNDLLTAESLSTSARVKATQFMFGGFSGSPLNTHGFSGNFFMESFAITGEYQGAVTFEASFKSADTVTFSAA